MKDLKVKTQEVKKGAVKRANDLEQSSLNSLEENTISPTVKVPAALLSTLKSLQKQSTKVEQDGERANASLYNHLVNAYRWWRKAKEIEGFIEAEYEKLPLRKSSGQADPNFIPVLRVICGKDSSLQDQEFQRRSRALNAIHIEVEKTPEKYESGGIAKLVNFIKFKGGVSELAGYRNSDQGPAEKYEDTAESKQKAKEEEANRSALINAAVNPIVPYDEGASPIIDGLPDYVSTDERNCFLLLVQQADGGNRVIARSSEPELIETILVGNHRKRFEAHSSVTRPLLELIQTQCYPKHLKGVAKKLVDTNVLDGHGRKKFKSTPRLMFVHDSQQFLLSPINAYSGVVSLVTA